MSEFSLSAINRVIGKNKDKVSSKKPIPVLSDARKKSDEDHIS